MKKPDRVIFALLLASAVPQSVTAQQPDTVRLEPLTVTATRVPVRLSDVTASLTVLDGDDLRAAGITNVADALRTVPGVASVQSGSFGGTTSIFLRGGESDYTQVMVDGVPVNDPGGAYDFAYLSTANVDRIEILRGPGSVLYGSDGMTGVVNVITNTGDRDTFRASARGGSLGSVFADAGVDHRSSRAVFRSALHRARSEGMYAFNNRFDNTVFSGRVDYQADDRTQVDVTMRYRDSRYGFPTASDGTVEDLNAATLNEHTTLGVRVSRSLTDQLTLEIQAGSNIGSGGTDDPPDSPADTLGFYAFTSLQDLSRQHVETRLRFETVGGLHVSAGTQYEQQKERSFSESQSAFGPFNGSSNHRRSNTAYYAQGLVTRGRVSGQLGVRSDVNDAFGTFHTYRAGARVLIGGGTTARASVGRSFKAPTFFENYATGFVMGNPDLEPERAFIWEASLQQALIDERVQVVATWFQQEFRDLIQYNPAGTPNYENIAQADARGVEVEAAVRLDGGVRVRGNLTRLHSRVVDAGYDSGPGATFVLDQRLLRRPDWIGSASVGIHRSRGNGSVTLHYVGERDDLDFSAFPSARVALSSVVTVDAAGEIAVGPPAAGISLTLSVSNLLGQQYETVFGFPGRGRVVVGGFRLTR